MEKKIEMERMDLIKPKQIDQLARDYAQTFVKSDRLKTHQLRNVFSAIEKMRTKFKDTPTNVDKNEGNTEDGEKAVEKRKKNLEDLEMDLILLKPKIAYAAGRQRSVKENFFPFMQKAIDAVVETLEAKDISDEAIDKSYRNFFALMESVVGYHKFFESV